MTRLNLLPWREMRRKQMDRQLLAIGVGAWVACAAIVFYVYLHINGLTETQNHRNQYLEQEIAKVERDIKAIAELKRQRQALITRMNVIYQLQADRARLVHVFDELARRIPEGVYFTSIKHSGGGSSLQGVAQSNARVSALMRNLGTSDYFADPELEVINVKDKGSDRVSEFSLRVKQVNKKAQKLPEEPAS